jgi:hypothetical protein
MYLECEPVMTKDVLLTRIAAIVTTLEETDGSPESMLYIFCEMNMDDWQTLRYILISANIVSISKGHYVTLTENGKQTAIRLNKAIVS